MLPCERWSLKLTLMWAQVSGSFTAAASKAAILLNYSVCETSMAASSAAHRGCQDFLTNTGPIAQY